MAQQIAVRTRVEQGLIAFAAAFAQRKGHGAVGVARFERFDQRHEHRVGEKRILPALQHKGAKAEVIALIGALQDLLRRQPVAFDIPVASPDAAVQTIVFADV